MADNIEQIRNRNAWGVQIDIDPFTIGRELGEYDSGLSNELTQQALVYLEDMTSPGNINMTYDKSLKESGHREWLEGFDYPVGPYIIEEFPTVTGYFKRFRKPENRKAA
jgi:hypothetical protein